MGSGRDRASGGSPGFQSAFADMTAANQDAGIAPAKRGGLFGSGMSGEDWMNAILQAASIAQGDYAGGAQFGSLIGADRRMADQRNAKFEDWKRQFDYEADWKAANQKPDLPPIVRDAEAWAAMTPEQRAAYQSLEDVRNPIIRQGQDGLPYAHSRGQLPEGYDPNEWEVVPGPANGGPASAPGGFPGVPPRRYYR